MDPNKAETAEFRLHPNSPGSHIPAVASSQVQVDLGALSHQGKVRANNEDHYLVVRFGRHLETLLTNLPEGCVAQSIQEIGYGMVVADGMGGKAGGEIASRMAITTLLDLVLNTPDWVLTRIGEPETDEILQRFVDRYQKVDLALTQQGQKNPALTGMGTTMTLACSVGADLFLGHLGDSRIYFFRQGELMQMTNDHTLAQEMVDKGLIRKQEGFTYGWRHMLTRVIGGNWGLIEPEVCHLWLANRDQILLCTDGLTNMVDDAGIKDILLHADSSQQACQDLVDLALTNGGKDNVTVVLARYQFPF